MGLLESAIARPFQSFGGENLYSSPFEKAAAIVESLIINHPFVDGNKRTGIIVMIALLKESISGLMPIKMTYISSRSPSPPATQNMSKLLSGLK